MKPAQPDPDDVFGSAVAISGDLMVVGAPRFKMMLFKVVPPTESGVAYLFARQGSVWKQEGMLSPSPGSGPDMFGFHVSVHGETVLVGAPYDSQGGSHAGAVHSFTRSAGAWMLQQKVLASSPVAESSLGVTMAIEGDVRRSKPDDSAVAAAKMQRIDRATPRCRAARCTSIAKRALSSYPAACHPSSRSAREP